jgi:hypothetical protein
MLCLIESRSMAQDSRGQRLQRRTLCRPKNVAIWVLVKNRCSYDSSGLKGARLQLAEEDHETIFLRRAISNAWL